MKPYIRQYLKEGVGEIGPEQVEAGHLEGDEEHRVDSRLQYITHTYS